MRGIDAAAIENEFHFIGTPGFGGSRTRYRGLRMDEQRRQFVLVVEDSRTQLELYRQALPVRGFELATAGSAEAARAELKARVPELVLLDIFLPDGSGLDVLDELRRDPRTAATPVILISGASDTGDVVAGLERGANDYITKPVVLPILFARMDALLRTSALLRELEARTELLAKLAAFDELTGVYNRRSLSHSLEGEINRSRRHGHELSVVLIDLDHFKRVNDGHGHRAGDLVLRSAARTLQKQLRSMDIVCRYGGEEFCAILPDTGLSGAVRAAERVRAAIAAEAVDVGEAVLNVTLSAGVASYLPASMPEVPDLLVQADEALYAAKHQGRNRVCAHDGSGVEDAAVTARRAEA